ncbi:MAG: Slx4p interacting protein [Sclerophora amabilis]|nr:MAG: Slx4p interacting protein [Sclerophora amabilis]
MEARPIPAFYCCYLLRSTVRHASLYVGSTPNPARRLAQHNGRIKGGAVKTSRDSLRPWEMSCIVTGFPSHIAALQFEWAWQNTHMTRHIPASQRITDYKTSVRTSPKTGRARRRPQRPRASLIDKLSNLHLLLRVQTFRRWPLEVRFFCEDVFKVWERWAERVDGKIRDGIAITLDLKLPSEDLEERDLQNPMGSQAKGKSKKDAFGKGGVEGIDVGYAGLKQHLEKSGTILGQGREKCCAICHGRIEHAFSVGATCPQQGCEAVSHLICLSQEFLRHEDSEDIVPTNGPCPRCHQISSWVDITKELSLRMRGPTEMEKLLKNAKVPREEQPQGVTKKPKKGKKRPEQEADDAGREDQGIIESESDDSVHASDATNVIEMQSSPDDWIYREDSDDDMMSVASVASGNSNFSLGENSPSRRKSDQRLEIVIEDSEWDDAEVLD